MLKPRFIAIRDNRDRWPIETYRLKPGESTEKAVSRYQKNLAAMTPGGLCGVTWTVLDAKDTISAIIEASKRL